MHVGLQNKDMQRTCLGRSTYAIIRVALNRRTNEQTNKQWGLCWGSSRTVHPLIGSGEFEKMTKGMEPTEATTAVDGFIVQRSECAQFAFIMLDDPDVEVGDPAPKAGVVAVHQSVTVLLIEHVLMFYWWWYVCDSSKGEGLKNKRW